MSQSERSEDPRVVDLRERLRRMQEQASDLARQLRDLKVELSAAIQTALESYQTTVEASAELGGEG